MILTPIIDFARLVIMCSQYFWCLIQVSLIY